MEFIYHCFLFCIAAYLAIAVFGSLAVILGYAAVDFVKWIIKKNII